MNKIYNPNKETWSEILKRPTQSVADIEQIVLDIFKEVDIEGDTAIQRYTQKFDKVTLDSVLVSEEEIQTAKNNISQDLKNAILLAKSNIEAFHTAQKTDKVSVTTTAGVKCWQEKRPIQKVGLYIPGGTAPLFSTILMLTVPANIAGCKEIVLCTPPNQDGEIHPAILYTANLCGVTKICKVGGIQAIAGMTFGTQTIPQVYKIFGPGNQFVTVAKQLATKFGVAIDMPAGPSELLVVADDTANASFVASDLLSQAEHGEDSQVILVSTSKKMIEDVEKEIIKQCSVLPRKEIAEKAIANSKLIYVTSDQEALELINEYGPEHFIVCVKNEEFYIDNIGNAGSVFIGNYTPESAGDYASGTNHTLPTNGYAKQYSGVNLDSFMKSMTFQKISKEGILKIGNAIELMAEAEGLQAHKNAVTLRLEKINLEGFQNLQGLVKKKEMNKIQFDIKQLVRKNILHLKAYSSARDEFTDFDAKMIFLDANENPYKNGVNRYPDPQQKNLKAALAKQKNIPEKNILLGNGSDEVLDLIYRAFCEPGEDNIITLPPTYGMYTVLANINNIEEQQVQLDKDFQPDVEEIFRKVNMSSKVVFICSPNNPSGNLIEQDRIQQIVERFNGVVVIDEAYIDFTDKKSWLFAIKEYPNLIVTQTLSKAYGLAGIRLGICYASEEIISVLNKIKPPYNVNELTQQRALQRVLEEDKVKNEVKSIIEERAKLQEALSAISFVEKIFFSDANFILVRVDDANKRYNQLIREGIVVRNRSTQPLCENTLRFTVGTTEENKIVIEALKQL